MAIRKIVEIPNPVLTTETQKIKDFGPETKKLADDLLDTVRVAEDPEGAGLAATQIGVGKRMCVVRNFIENPTNPEKVIAEDIILINPKIISTSKETEINFEGCLSVPDKYGGVERYKKIKVKAFDVDGNPIRLKATGFLARTAQHEIDHLDGILFTERVIGKTISEKELDEIFAHAQ